MFYKYYLSQTYSRLLNRTKPVKDIDPLDYFSRFQKLLKPDGKTHPILSLRIHANIAVAYSDLDYSLKRNISKAYHIEEYVRQIREDDSIVLWLYGRHLRKLFLTSKPYDIRHLEASISVLQRSVQSWYTRHKTHHHLALAYKSRWQFEKKHFLSLSRKNPQRRFSSQGLAHLTEQMENLSLRSATGEEAREIDIFNSDNPMDDIPRSRYLERARRHLNEAIRLDCGKCGLYLIDKSRVCMSLQDFNEAQRCLMNAHKISVPGQEAYLFEQWGLLYQYHQDHFENVHVSDAKRMYYRSVQASVREKRPSRRALFQLFNILREEEKVCEDRSKIQKEIADLLVLNKKYDEAIELLQKLPDSIVMLVKAYVEAERFHEAYTYLLKSLENNVSKTDQYKQFFFETAMKVINNMDEFSRRRIYGDLCNHFGPSQMKDYSKKEYDIYLYRPYEKCSDEGADKLYDLLKDWGLTVFDSCKDAVFGQSPFDQQDQRCTQSSILIVYLNKKYIGDKLDEDEETFADTILECTVVSVAKRFPHLQVLCVKEESAEIPLCLQSLPDLAWSLTDEGNQINALIKCILQVVWCWCKTILGQSIERLCKRVKWSYIFLNGEDKIFLDMYCKSCQKYIFLLYLVYVDRFEKLSSKIGWQEINSSQVNVWPNLHQIIQV